VYLAEDRIVYCNDCTLRNYTFFAFATVASEWRQQAELEMRQKGVPDLRFDCEIYCLAFIALGVKIILIILINDVAVLL
jgi:hypothetical protein